MKAISEGEGGREGGRDSLPASQGAFLETLSKDSEGGEERRRESSYVPSPPSPSHSTVQYLTTVLLGWDTSRTAEFPSGQSREFTTHCNEIRTIMVFMAQLHTCH